MSVSTKRDDAERAISVLESEEILLVREAATIEYFIEALDEEIEKLEREVEALEEEAAHTESLARELLVRGDIPALRRMFGIPPQRDEL